MINDYLQQKYTLKIFNDDGIVFISYNIPFTSILTYVCESILCNLLHDESYVICDSNDKQVLRCSWDNNYYKWSDC